MGRIIVSENVTIDGVVEDPAGTEGFERGGWVGTITATGRGAVAAALLEEAMAAEALLLGRRSYEFLAARWPSRDGALADRLNGLPKYVLSSTLHTPSWGETTVLAGDAMQEISSLRQQVDGDVVVYASFSVVRALLDHDLVDGLRLLVHPVILGAGRRLVDGTTRSTPMRLVACRTIGDGLVSLRYVRA